MLAFLATFAWNPKNVNTARRMPAASRVLCVIIPKLSADNNLLAERKEQKVLRRVILSLGTNRRRIIYIFTTARRGDSLFAAERSFLY